MAKSTPKKKAAPAAKRPTAKPAAKKVAASKAKPAAKKAAPTKKPVPKKPVAKSKPAPKPAGKAKPTPKAKPVKPAQKAKSPLPPLKPAPKRPVAVSHRPQASAVAVQARAPAKATASPARQRPIGRSELPKGASLTEDQVRRAPDSAYMNDNQLSFFQERLLQMRGEVLTRELDVKERLHQREVFADPADRASAEEEHWLDLRLRERESLLLKKIDDALRRIRDRDYGYCEKTGEAIGIARLLARPTATVCVDIKGQDERAESQYRDR